MTSGARVVELLAANQGGSGELRERPVVQQERGKSFDWRGGKGVDFLGLG